MAKIDLTMLDMLRQQADPEADRLAEHYLDRKPSDFFAGAMAARYARTDAADPHIAKWLSDRPDLPAWADQARLQRGSEFFSEWGIELGLGLFLSSMPLAYAAEEGARVLALTSRLETDAKRRVLESAQFVLEVTAPGALARGQSGYDTVRLVRLMHAGVRQLILTDPRLPHTSVPEVWPRWDDAWGMPINQEHLIGALISYSSSLLHVLDVLNITYDQNAASDYCHLWNVVGWLLGIDGTLLPLERDELDRIDPLIRQHTYRASDVGTQMTAALIELVKSFVPFPPIRGLAVSTVRLFVGEETADLLGVPKADWTRHLVGGMRRVSHRMSLSVAHDRMVRRVVSRLSQHTLEGFVHHERHGERPSFTIPDHLEILRRRPARRSKPRRAPARGK